MKKQILMYALLLTTVGCAQKQNNVLIPYSSYKSQNLSSGYYSYSKLQGCDFYDANVENAQLNSADLSAANFTKANGYGAIFDFANLEKANFTQADLRRASFKGAHLDGANFKEANLTGAIWVDGRICQDGSMSECKLKK